MIGFGLFLASFLYYGLRAASGPAWLDGSELVAAGHLLAVPHPTGAPIYLVLTKLALLLPIGPPAVRVAWLSGLFAALAVERLFAVTDWLCRESGARTRWTPALASVLFALIPGSLAIGHRAELYSLQLWLALTALHLALRLRETGAPRYARLGGLVLGLAAATHPYLTALMIPGLLLVAGRALLRPQLLLATVGFALLAGSSYGILALRGQAGGLVGWGDATTWAGWLDILTARAFQKGFAAPLSGSGAQSLALFSANQLGLAGGLLVPAAAVWALVHFIRGGRRSGQLRPAIALSAGLALIVVAGLASRALWPFDPNTPDTAGYFALPLAVVVALAARAGSRLELIAAARSWPRPVAPLTLLGVAGGLLASIGIPPANAIEGDAGRELGLRALAPLEPGAVVMLDDFNLLFMTWYLQAVEGVRPDVTVVFGGFLSQPWYRARLARHAPDAAAAPAVTAALYVDYGIGAAWLPAPLRAHLVPAGLLLRAGGAATPVDATTWMTGRPALDPQTQRALIWLHFRHACWGFARGDRAAVAWHDQQIEALQPGVHLAEALARGQGAVCGGEIATAPAPQL